MTAVASRIPLSRPDVGEAEMEAASRMLASPRYGEGRMVEAFERAFADRVGRRHAVAVTGGTPGLFLALRASGVGPGDAVIVSPFSWFHAAHAVALCGATPVFADVDYWTCILDPAKAEAKVDPNTRAVVVGNVDGHPADWDAFTELAERHGLALIEDATESVAGSYKGTPLGRFGRASVFSLESPGALGAPGFAAVVTDDDALARDLRFGRARTVADRYQVLATRHVPLGAGVSDLSAAVALVQLSRLDDILARRKAVEAAYHREMKSFEGIKDPYVAPWAAEVHRFLYMVHLGTRFPRDARDQIVEDLRAAGVDAADYCQPLHFEHAYVAAGGRKGDCPIAEKNAFGCIALPLHGGMTDAEVSFIVKTIQDASVNVGAGSAIYL